MRIWQLPEPAPIATAPLRMVEAPTPTPGPGEVLIRVLACGLCRTDLHIIEGELPVRRPGITPGHQVVGEVMASGPVRANKGPSVPVGARVGVAWLHRTCGHCRFCRSGRENLCENAEFTGWTVPGGFAEYLLADADFVYPLPAELGDATAAPLLCAGIIGYRCLRRCELEGRWAGTRLGIYGFGAAGHVCIQLARSRGAQVYVATRDRERHQPLARELGAVWVGDADAIPPEPLDAAIMFAPAGELVPPALRALDAGARLVLGGIHMSPIPQFKYDLLYRERSLRSVTNNTRADGQEFLAEAARVGVKPRVQVFPFEALNEALLALKNDKIAGAAVLTVAES